MSGHGAVGGRHIAAVLAALAVAAALAAGCGANDDGGVITPPKSTTPAPTSGY